MVQAEKGNGELSLLETQKLIREASPEVRERLLNAEDGSTEEILSDAGTEKPSEDEAAQNKSGGNGEDSSSDTEHAGGDNDPESKTSSGEEPPGETDDKDNVEASSGEDEPKSELEKQRLHAEASQKEVDRLGNELGHTRSELAATKSLVTELLQLNKEGATEKGGDSKPSSAFAEAIEKAKEVLGADYVDTLVNLISAKEKDADKIKISKDKSAREFLRVNTAAIKEKYPDFEQRIPIIAAIARAEKVDEIQVKLFEDSPYSFNLQVLDLYCTKVDLLAAQEKLKATSTKKEKPGTDEIVEGIKEAAKNSVKSGSSSPSRAGKKKIDISKLTAKDINSRTPKDVIDAILARPG